MQSIQTGCVFDLAKVKPFKDLAAYRSFSIRLLKESLTKEALKREKSPFRGEPLKLWGSVEGVSYCSDKTGNLFLENLPERKIWNKLLIKLNEYRHTQVLNADIRSARQENIFKPKRDWMENNVQLYGFPNSKVLEISLPHSEFSETLKKSPLFQEVLWISEIELTDGDPLSGKADAVVLLESLDRSADPEALLRNSVASLKKGGLLFSTSLVASGFDFITLEDKNAYLIPPDRTNCFTLNTLQKVLENAGCQLLEVSTPGLLDVAVVKAHREYRDDIPLSPFERQLLEWDEEKTLLFQNFLQQVHLSSYARLAARKI